MTNTDDFDALVDEMWELYPEGCQANLAKRTEPLYGTALPGEETYAIYAISINGCPVYIGRTKRPDSRWAEHKRDARKFPRRRLYRAMLKAGLAACSYDILFARLTRAEAHDFESELLEMFDGCNSAAGTPALYAKTNATRDIRKASSEKRA